MNLEDLLILVRCKRFSEAAADIKRAVLQKRESLLLIYEIANAVMHKQILSSDENEDFISLLIQYKNRTSHLIHDYIDKETIKYYNCMHFIVKYVASRFLVKLLDLRELIILHPEQVRNNESALTYYTATYNLIFKHTIESSELTHNHIIDLILLQFEMRLANCRDFTFNISASFANLCNTNINPQMQLDCLIKLLSLEFPNDQSSALYSAILNALQYIYVSAKRESFKIDLGVVIVLLNRKSTTKCNFSEAIIRVLTILNLEDIQFLPELKIALKTDLFKINNAKFVSDLYLFVIAGMQMWIFNETTKQYISECTTDFLEIVKIIQTHLISNMKACQCCSTKIELTGIYQLINATVELLKYSENISYLIELYKPMLYISTDLMIQLKSANCQLFGKHWSKCSAVLNSLGAAMSTDNSNANGSKFLLLLMKQIGQFGFSSNFPKGTLYFIYNLVGFFKERKDYKSAVLFTSIAMYVDRINVDKILPLYTQALYNFNLTVANGNQLYSIVQVLNANIDLTRDYIPTIDPNRFAELFEVELNFYINKWKSKTYLMNLIKQMAKFSQYNLITSTIRKNYTLFVNLDDDMIVVLKNLLKHENKSNLNSALMNYLIANNITHSLIQKNQIDMNNTVIAPSSHFEPGSDPHDTCDIVSSYSSLNLENHKTIVAYLKRALLDIELSYAEELELAFDLCSKLAHSFRLQCNFTSSESAWMLAKTIASKLNSNTKLLEAIGWLLHKADSNETTLRLLETSNIIANKLPVEDNCLSLCWYHLHISNFHLRNSQWDLAKHEYNTTHDLMRLIMANDEDDQIGFTTHFAFLQSMMSRMPCETALNKTPHLPDLLPKNALKMLISFINKIGYTKIDAFHLTAYFEELEDILMRFSLMRLPREVRLYGKDVVILSQKLVLSFRTARILTHLARADVLTCKISDCQVKLNGIADIINLPVIKPANYEYAVKDNVEDCREIIDNKLVDQIRDVQLNVPQSSSMTGSPIFNKRVYNIPPFISHTNKCCCFECSTPEYAILILGKLHIDFLLSQSERNSSISEAISEMAARVYNFLITRKTTFYSIDYARVYNETYAYFLLDYTLKIQMMRENLNQAKNINTQIIELLKGNNKYQSDLLICEVNCQRALIIMHETSLNKTKTTNDDLYEPHETQTDQTIDKTPENNYLNKSVEDKLLISAMIIEKRRKNIPFHLSDDEEDVEQKPKSKKPQNKSSKFKVFDDNMKPVSTQKSARNKTQTVLNTAFRHPSSSAKVKERTAKKTKLLTEKLKKSAREVESESSSDAHGFSKPIKTGRKNLLHDLTDCEQTTKLNVRMIADGSESSGVRRSTRKK